MFWWNSLAKHKMVEDGCWRPGVWGKWLGSREEWSNAKNSKVLPLGLELDWILFSEDTSDGSGPSQKVLKLNPNAVIQFSMWDLCAWRRCPDKFNLSVHALSFSINWLLNKWINWLPGCVCRVWRVHFCIANFVHALIFECMEVLIRLLHALMSRFHSLLD